MSEKLAIMLKAAEGVVCKQGAELARLRAAVADVLALTDTGSAKFKAAFPLSVSWEQMGGVPAGGLWRGSGRGCWMLATFNREGDSP